jgi:predicted nucleotidyltransferase
LPEAVRESLERFAMDLVEGLGDDLVSIIVFGGVARGEYDRTQSDVDLMVVITEVNTDLLDRAVKPVRTAVREIRAEVVVVTETDLRRSTDAFPVKCLDVKRHHKVIYGRNVIKQLEIARDHLRLRCEQEIKDLLLRLRTFYLLRSNLPEALEQTLGEAVSSLLTSLAVVAELKTGEPPADQEETLEAIAKLGLSPQPIRDVLAMQSGEKKLDAAALKPLYDAFLRFVDAAADAVDRLDEVTA